MAATVQVSADRVQAILRLSSGFTLNATELGYVLRDAGVVHGIQEAVVAQAAQAEDKHRELVVAKGTAPKPGRSGRLEPPPPADEPTWKEAGEDLGQWQAPEPAVDGVGVDGRPIVAPRPSTWLEQGPGVRVHAGHVYAEHAGWFGVHEGQVTVDIRGLPVNSAAVEIIVAADGSRASLDIPVGKRILLGDLRQKLTDLGVVHGLDPQAMQEAMQAKKTKRSLVLAWATQPRHGTDTRLELLVKLRPPLEPDEQGNLDFRGWSSIVQVREGQPLARLTAPSHGVPGCTVVGKPIPARSGSVLGLERFLGEGACADPQDPLQILAGREGVFQRAHDGKIHVVQLLVIEGDVDLRTGSIATKYAVVVQGDIKSGFTVKSGSDIEVKGVIEDARVTAQGNLEVRGGILPGHNRVKAHGNISASFVRDRLVKCADLIVRESVRGGQVLATGMVSAKEVAGCDLKAAGDVRCERLGAPLGSHTQVHVGVNPFVRSLVEEARARKVEIETRIEQAHERARLTQAHLDRLAKKFQLTPNRTLKEEIESVASECRRALRAFQAVQSELEACGVAEEELAKEMYETGGTAQVIATRNVYPPCTVRVGPTWRLEVVDELQASTFHAGV